jgi:transposase
MAYFGGLDWGCGTHAVCVVDETGKVVVRLSLGHDAAGLESLHRTLKRLGPAGQIPIAIERPSGLIVDALVGAGHPVVPIHPNVVKACRPRYRAAGGKSDPGDAYMLADILRTDGHRFRPLEPASDELKALQALVRSRSDLVGERVAQSNRLLSLLESFWPGPTRLFASIDSQISLAFLTRWPTPASAAGLTEEALAAFLKDQGYSGRRSAAELRARLLAAPAGLAGEAESAAKGSLVLALVRLLGTLIRELAALTHAIEQAVAELPEGKVVMSFPRAGRICAAQVVAELGDVKERFQTADQLAAEAGVCPVTHASGKSRSVVFRYACNHRLRAAITTLADNSRHQSAWAAQVYKQARERGCAHAHAIRILARAWIRILWRAWRDGKPYSENDHTAAAALCRG